MGRSHANGLPSRRSFVSALKVQLRVLYALILREASLRLGPYRLGHVLVLAEMIWGTAFLGFIRALLEQPPPYGTSVVFYMFSGMFPYTLYRTLHTRVAAAVDANRALLSYPVIRPLDTLLARAGLESTFQLTAFLIFYVTFVWLGYAGFPAHPVELLAAMAATILLGFSMGITGMVLASLWKPWATIDSMIAKVLFFVSGVFFQIEFMPPHIREFMLLNPLAHAIEWIRYCLYPGYFTQVLDRGYLLAWGVIGTVFGLGMERLLRARLLEGK